MRTRRMTVLLAAIMTGLALAAGAFAAPTTAGNDKAAAGRSVETVELFEQPMDARGRPTGPRVRVSPDEHRPDAAAIAVGGRSRRAFRGSRRRGQERFKPHRAARPSGWRGRAGAPSVRCSGATSRTSTSAGPIRGLRPLRRTHIRAAWIRSGAGPGPRAQRAGSSRGSETAAADTTRSARGSSSRWCSAR